MVTMPINHHIEREALAAATGMTSLERDQTILRMRRKGFTQTQIANHLGCSQPAIKYALDRLAGKKRNRTTYDMCEGCGRNVPKDQLNRDGLCEACND
jgi:predicted ArsR family transcriptional regulator